MTQPLSVRFLQLSDVHLGASTAASRLGYSPERAAQRAAEVQAAFAGAMRLAVEERCDGVLLPGDLFDGEAVDDAVAAAAFAAIRELAPLPVFLTPGNHDPYSPEGPYGEARWRLLAGGEGPPANLVLFRDERFVTVPWPGRPDVTVTGAAFLRPTAVRERRLQQPVVDPASLAPDRIHLALLHGSRDDSGLLQAHKATLPFSAAELAAQPFDYVAVGHYHSSAPILDPATGEVRGGYAGMPAFIGLDEDGEKSVLLVEVDLSPGPPRRRVVRARNRVVDPRRLHRLVVDVTGRRDSEQALAALVEQYERAGVRPVDAVAVRFQGRLAAKLGRQELPEMAAAWLSGRCWHAAAWCAGIEPDLDVSRFLEGESRTLQALFARELAARAGDPALAPRERELARRALAYGIEALETGRIRRRWEPDVAGPAWSAAAGEAPPTVPETHGGGGA